jgi:hypothetical protein
MGVGDKLDAECSMTGFMNIFLATIQISRYLQALAMIL